MIKMAKRNKELIEKAGLDVKKSLELLIKAAAAEFTTYSYYTILRNHATGLEREAIKEIIEDARIEDRNHFEALIPRIYELWGKLPNDVNEFASISSCMDAKLPEEPTIENILKVLLDAEKCAISVYTPMQLYTRQRSKNIWPRTRNTSRRNRTRSMVWRVTNRWTIRAL